MGLDPPLHLGWRLRCAAAAEVHPGTLGCVQGAIGEGTSGGDVTVNMGRATWKRQEGEDG